MAYGYTSGPAAPPGQYTAQLTYGGQTLSQTFDVRIDPRWTATAADLQAQFELAVQARDELDRIHLAIRKIRSVRLQTTDLVARAERAGKGLELKKLTTDLLKKLTDLEGQLIQTKNKAGQDPINYPPRLDDQIDYAYSVINEQDARPTQGCYDLFADLKKQSESILTEVETVISAGVKIVNEFVQRENLGGVVLEGIR